MISDAFETLKSNLELAPSFDEKIQARHRGVRRILEGQDPVPDTKLIGSVARKTRIHPLQDDVFDVDILMVLGSFYRWNPTASGITPDAAIQTALHMVQQSERYAAMSPEADHPAVTIFYQDRTKVEIVPAYKDQIGLSPDGTHHSPIGRGYWVPKQGRWELTDYDYDAKYVTAANAQNGEWIVPTVKMLKAIRRRYITSIKSYPFEVLAVNSLPIPIASQTTANLPVTFPYLINRFFHLAPIWFTGPIVLPGSLTPALYLTQQEREPLAKIFGSLARYTDTIIALAERDQMKHWKELFGAPFPAT